jgi:hypothetical protein
MHGPSGWDASETSDGEGSLDPHAAARLLEQTGRRARRDLDFRSPWLSLLAAPVMLLAFGCIWLSVRGQHPYKGPTPEGLIGLYVLVTIRIGTVLRAQRRAQAGVSGQSVRRRQAEAAALVGALLAVYTVMGALASDGASDGIVYGVYVSTATLLVLGTFGAARSAVREEWPQLGLSLGILLVAAASAFAGPRGVWLADGIGCCVVLLAYATAQAWLPQGARSVK